MAYLKPKQVILEVTSRCNLQCKFCPNTCNKDFKEGDMDLALFKSLVDTIALEMPETTVIPWMNGEPFLHPDYLEMVKYLSKKGLRFYVTTNLTVWREDILKFLLSDKSTCYQLIVSMDGLPMSKSIELARPGTNPAMLVMNVNRLIRMKRDLDSKKNIAVKICERGQDWEEIEEYVQEWLYEDDAVDYVCVGKPLKDMHEPGFRRYPCQYFDRNFMIIRWNGDVVPCAYNDEVANKGALTYGKAVLATSSLLAIYNNPQISKLRDEQHKGKFTGPCETCGFAYTGFGFRGSVAFRKDPEQSYFFQQDYYNMFFSKKRDWKPDSYYEQEE